MKNLDPDAVRGVVEAVMARLAQSGVASRSAPAPAPSPAPAPVQSQFGGRPARSFRLPRPGGEAAHEAFLKLKKMGVEGRSKVVDIVKSMCTANAEPWGKFELDETQIGRLDHKIEKLQIIATCRGSSGCGRTR
jgi:aldehyde dehydrogenase